MEYFNFINLTLAALIFQSATISAGNILVDEDTGNSRSVAANSPAHGNVWTSLAQSFTAESPRIKFGFKLLDFGDPLSPRASVIYNLYEGENSYSTLLGTRTVKPPLTAPDGNFNLGFVDVDFSAIILTVGQKYTMQITVPSSSLPPSGGYARYDVSTSLADPYAGGRFYFPSGYNNDFFPQQDMLFRATSVTVSSPKQQTIYLAFGQDAPFRLRGAFNFYFEAAGTTSAATLTTQYKTEILAAVKQMFSASGILNIKITDVPTAGATTVYFSNENLNISGKALGGVDRFNERAEDQVIVYTFGDAIYDAETVAHEVGHSLGLLHVNPGTRSTSEGLIKEIMFAPEVTGALPRFINAVSDHDSLNVADTLYTHNPLYHLKRHVDGYTSGQLEAQGILPGTWDLPSTDLISMKLDFEDTQRTLYNVVLLRSSDGTNSVAPFAQFDAITLAELEQKRFHLVPGSSLSLVGSSTPDGEADLLLSTGDPNSESSRFVPADTGTMDVSLHQINDAAFEMIAGATTAGELVPQLPTVVDLSKASTPGQFSMTFAGDIGANFIIETSTDQHSWSECESVRAEGVTTTVLLTAPASDTKRFWRIKRGRP